MLLPVVIIEAWQLYQLKIKFYPAFLGCAIAQVVRLSATMSWVQSQVRPCGLCGGQSSTGAGFLQVLLYPLPLLILPIVVD
jgi:hypothetical protein